MRPKVIQFNYWYAPNKIMLCYFCDGNYHAKPLVDCMSIGHHVRYSEIKTHLRLTTTDKIFNELKKK